MLQLFVYDEIPDYDPDYPAAVSILREVQPTFLITFGNVANNFVKLLIDLLNGTSDNTISTDNVRSIPKNMELLHLKDYCKYKKMYCKITRNASDNL